MVESAAIYIDPKDGKIQIGENVTISAEMLLSDSLNSLARFTTSKRDMRTGYIWLDVKELTFGGVPAALSLCFFDGRLQAVGWGMRMEGVPADGNWPSRAESDAEVAFITSELQRQGHSLGMTPWGKIYAGYDEKSGCAQSGLRFN